MDLLTPAVNARRLVVQGTKLLFPKSTLTRALGPAILYSPYPAPGEDIVRNIEHVVGLTIGLRVSEEAQPFVECRWQTYLLNELMHDGNTASCCRFNPARSLKAGILRR